MSMSHPIVLCFLFCLLASAVSPAPVAAAAAGSEDVPVEIDSKSGSPSDLWEDLDEEFRNLTLSDDDASQMSATDRDQRSYTGLARLYAALKKNDLKKQGDVLTKEQKAENLAKKLEDIRNRPKVSVSFPEGNPLLMTEVNSSARAASPGHDAAHENTARNISTSTDSPSTVSPSTSSTITSRFSSTTSTSSTTSSTSTSIPSSSSTTTTTTTSTTTPAPVSAGPVESDAAKKNRTNHTNGDEEVALPTVPPRYTLHQPNDTASGEKNPLTVRPRVVEHVPQKVIAGHHPPSSGAPIGSFLQHVSPDVFQLGGNSQQGLIPRGDVLFHPEGRVQQPTLAFIHPGAALFHPEGSVQQPSWNFIRDGDALSHPGGSVSVQQPSLDFIHPDGAIDFTTRPGGSVQQSSLNFIRPGDYLSHPGGSVSVQQPSLDFIHPDVAIDFKTHPGGSVSVQQPSWNFIRPGDDLSHPGGSVSAQQPSLDFIHPDGTLGLQTPSGGSVRVQQPSSNFIRPGDAFFHPGESVSVQEPSLDFIRLSDALFHPVESVSVQQQSLDYIRPDHAVDIKAHPGESAGIQQTIPRGDALFQKPEGGVQQPSLNFISQKNDLSFSLEPSLNVIPHRNDLSRTEGSILPYQENSSIASPGIKDIGDGSHQKHRVVEMAVSTPQHGTFYATNWPLAEGSDKLPVAAEPTIHVVQVPASQSETLVETLQNNEVQDPDLEAERDEAFSKWKEALKKKKADAMKHQQPKSFFPDSASSPYTKLGEAVPTLSQFEAKMEAARADPVHRHDPYWPGSYPPVKESARPYRNSTQRRKRGLGFSLPLGLFQTHSAFVGD